MPANREHALQAIARPGRVHRKGPPGRWLRKGQLRQEDSTAHSRGTAIRSVTYSATGYLLTLATGRIAAEVLGSGDSLAGLGLASLAAIVVAPAAAAAGAAIGLLPLRKLRLFGNDARLSAAGFIVTTLAAIAAWIWVDALSALWTGLLALTASLILRAGLLERVHQGSSNPNWGDYRRM